MANDSSNSQNGDNSPSSPIRTRTGCLTCRRRKKKCDEGHPCCLGCQRNRLECQWESPDALLKPRRRQRRAKSPENSLPEEVQRMMKVFFVLTPDIATRLLRHFLDDSPKWLSTRIGSRRTDYLNWLSPAISDSPLVFNCILAIASADLLKYNRRDREMHQAAVEYYGKSVSSLREAIEHEMSIASPSHSPLPDHTPLAVLLLCVHETQNFTESERILPHLNAALFLLQNRISCQNSDKGLRGFLFETFCYFFALASFSLGSKLPLYRANNIFNAPSVIEQIRDGHIMGTSQQLFITIYRVSSLAQRLASKNPADIFTVRAELMLLDQDLADSCAKESLDQSIMGLEHFNDAITSELYRLACRIHIRKLLASTSPDEDRTILSLVEDFIQKLHVLPPNSPSHSILSWPLVVTGFAARNSAHQRIIVAKLAQIYDEWQSDIFSKGAAFLQEKWRGDKGSRHELSDAIGSLQPFGDCGTIWYKCPVILA